MLKFPRRGALCGAACLWVQQCLWAWGAISVAGCQNTHQSHTTPTHGPHCCTRVFELNLLLRGQRDLILLDTGHLCFCAHVCGPCIHSHGDKGISQTEPRVSRCQGHPLSGSSSNFPLRLSYAGLFSAPLYVCVCLCVTNDI